ncbi:MAG: phenol hydroxylase subunit P4 [Gammaproteobacteria bacterium]|nr:phenol hydroxylase subunit P4 [Gammaproteobacteria bacterium]
MSNTTPAGYEGTPLDKVENFHGNQLIYLDWEKHRMFCSPICVPVPPDAPFGIVCDDITPNAYGEHPDWQHIDWSEVQWTLDDEPFQPDMDKSLKDQGIHHKSVLRFYQPGLDGLEGTGG